MGINIHLVRTDMQGANGLHEPAFWDWIRFSGDREFIDCDSIGWEHTRHGPTDSLLQKPKDYAVARQWVREHVGGGNQSRLLELLDYLEREPAAWLEIT